MSEKCGLNNLFTVRKGNDEAYIRICGATQSVKGSDIVKDIKEPLQLKYKEWQGNLIQMIMYISTLNHLLGSTVSLHQTYLSTLIWKTPLY